MTGKTTVRVTDMDTRMAELTAQVLDPKPAKKASRKPARKAAQPAAAVPAPAAPAEGTPELSEVLSEAIAAQKTAAPARTAAQAAADADAAAARLSRPATAISGRTVELTRDECALAYATLGRFGYRAFDAWGEAFAPYASLGEPVAVELPETRWAALGEALAAHDAWVLKKGDPKSPLARRDAIKTLRAKVAAQ